LNAAPPMQPPSDRLVAAHLIYRMEPFYPKEALQQRMEGIVKIHATVGRDGKVKNLTVVSGPASLTSAALDAAQYWRYVPALRNGQPVETDEDISIEFHLPH
jgi:periplasmic protein TonB